MKNRLQTREYIRVLQILLFISCFTFAALQGVHSQDQFTIQQASHFGGLVTCSQVTDTTAYLGQGPFLSVLALTGNEITQKNSLSLPSAPENIFVSGKYAYIILSRDSGLCIVDITNPLLPILLGRVAIKDVVGRSRVFSLGNTTAVTVNTDGLYLINTSNPSLPQIVGTYPAGAGNFNDVFLAGNYAYVVDKNSNELLILDITNPTNIIKVGSLAVGTANAVYVSGNYAFLAGGRTQLPNPGMVVIDISTPTTPTQVGFLSTNIGNIYFFPDQISINNSTAYMTGTSRLAIADISIPTNPTMKGIYQFPGASARNLAVRGDSVYISVPFAAKQFLEIDVTTPANPQITRMFETPWDLSSMAALRDTLFISSPNAFMVYDISKRETPNRIHSDTVGRNFDRMALTDSKLYASSIDNLFLFDVSRVDTLIKHSTYKSSLGQIRELSARENLAYIISNNNNLEIIDFTNPANPVRRSLYTFQGQGRDLFIRDGSRYAFIGYYNDINDKGFRIVDVSDSTNPVFLGAAQTKERPICIWVNADTVFIGSNYTIRWYLESFIVTDPKNIIKHSEVSGIGEIWEVQEYDGYAFAFVKGGSVEVFKTAALTDKITCHSKTTVGGLVVPTASITGTAATVSTEGYGYESSKMISPDEGVIIQTVRIPPKKMCGIDVTQEFISPAPPKGPTPPMDHTCEVQPSGVQRCVCGTNQTLSAIYTPTCCRECGWNFYEWRGCAGGKSEVVIAKCADCIAIAVWIRPVLSISTTANPQQFCASEDNSNRTALSFDICVNSIDDWELTGLKFTAGGSGDDAKDIDKVKLLIDGNEVGESKYSGNDGTVQFTLTTEVKAGACVVATLVYQYKKLDCPDLLEPIQPGGDVSKTYTATIPSSDVTAAPKKYPNSIDVGSVTGILELGCIQNINTKKFFQTITDAVKDQATQDGHTIEVCPGTYEDNVIVTKSLHIKSRQGRGVTFVDAKESNKDVFTLQKNDTKIEGFTIEKATTKSGILISGESVKNCEIIKNNITKNANGVSIQNSGTHIIGGDAQQKGNLISGNTTAGILLEGDKTTGNKIQGNSIGTDAKDETAVANQTGIHIRNGANKNSIGGTSEPLANVISGNSKSGIHLEGTATSGNEITGNVIGANRTVNKPIANKEGIRLDGDARNNIIGGEETTKRNYISGNTENGIIIAQLGTKNNRIEGNFIGTDKNGTTPLPNKVGIGIVGNPTPHTIGGTLGKTGNVISGNTDAGIGIQTVQNISIKGNFIGTDPTGTKRVPNGDGIQILRDALQDTIGSMKEEERNIISGNDRNGIYMAGTKENVVIGNNIGTDISGSFSVENSNNGLLIDKATSFNMIGLPTGGGNLISGNKNNGILITGDDCRMHYVLGNRIGTKKNGVEPLPNKVSGIELFGKRETGEAPGNIFIGGSPFEPKMNNPNTISGNGGNGIWLHGYSLIQTYTVGNRIGTDSNGDIPVPNSGSGIFLSMTTKHWIGLEDGGGNVISGNVKSGVVIHGITRMIQVYKNFIGTNKNATLPIPNGDYGILLTDGAEQNHIGGDRAKGICAGNVISGNGKSGICVRNLASGVDFVCNRIGTGEDERVRIPNTRYGFDADNNKWIEIGMSPKGANVISANGQGGAYVGSRGGNVYLERNKIGTDFSETVNLGNKGYGIEFSKGSENNQAARNIIWYNCGGVLDSGRYTWLIENSLKFNKCSTGLHLGGFANTRVKGNQIAFDFSSGIVCDGNASPLVLRNNISDNARFALENAGAAPFINAQKNWWGNSSGPGSAVSGNVDFSNWLTEPAGVVVAGGRDTMYVPIGGTDSLSVFLCNWVKPDDIVTLSLLAADPSWLNHPSTSSVALDDSLGGAVRLRVAVPSNVVPGRTNTVTMTAESLADPQQRDTNIVVLVAYERKLERVVITQDTTIIPRSGSHQFVALGEDAHGNLVDMVATWNADGGSIDSTGMYTAGYQTGYFSVNARDTLTGMQGSGVIRIIPRLERLIISPDSVNLKPGESQQFTVKGLDSTGAEVPMEIEWDATAYKISRTGLFTANDVSGEYLVRAEDMISGVRDSALIRITATTDIDRERGSVENGGFYLLQNYPNPFSRQTVIHFWLQVAGSVNIEIFDLLGRQVATVVDQWFDAGEHEEKFSAKNGHRILKPGMYIYQLRVNGSQVSRKMMIIE